MIYWTTWNKKNAELNGKELNLDELEFVAGGISPRVAAIGLSSVLLLSIGSGVTLAKSTHTTSAAPETSISMQYDGETSTNNNAPLSITVENENTPKAKENVELSASVAPGEAGHILYVYSGESFSSDWHKFTCVGDNIYFDSCEFPSIENNTNLINKTKREFDEAKKNVEKMFGGELKANVPILITNNQSINAPCCYYKNVQILKSKSGFFNSSHLASSNESFIKIFKENKIDSSYISHELIHAELAERINNSEDKLPAWFNEGLATQADNFGKFGTFSSSNEDEILSSDYFTDKKQNTEFYASSQYLINQWFKIGGTTELLNLIDEVNAGKDLKDVFLSSQSGKTALENTKNAAGKTNIIERI